MVIAEKLELKAQSVIFDFDGVIVDTEPLHYRAFQRILEPLGLGFDWQAYVDIYMGFDDRDAFVEAFKAGGRDLRASELTQLVHQKALIFQEVIRDGVTPYPGVVELIKQLKADGMPLAICSGALRSDILPILAMLSIEDCFDILVTADDVAKSKPDPASYKLAFQRLHESFPVISNNTSLSLAIEDTPAGIASAKGTGLSVLSVTNSYSASDLTSADWTVTSLADITVIVS